MHYLPDSFDGSLFLGTEIELVCFFPFSIALGFSGDTSKWIQIESEWILRCGNEVLEHITEFPIQSSKLLSTIGKKVLKFDINREKNNILLHLDSDMSIEVVDTPNGYETYKIDDGEQDIIV